MKIFLPLFLLIFFSLNSFCQVHITGYVIDSITREPLSGAQIIIEGTDVETWTDSIGQFDLKYNSATIIKDSIIQISAYLILYDSKTILIESHDPVVIELYLDSEKLKSMGFYDYKIKNNLNIGYFGDYYYAPSGFEINYYLDAINNTSLNLNFNYKYWTNLSNNIGSEFNFNYDIPNKHKFVPDNFHISYKDISYKDQYFDMQRTRAKLSNVFQGFAIDYGISHFNFDSLTRPYLAISLGGYFDMHELIYQVYLFDVFARGDYGNNKLYFEVGVIKGFYIRKFTSFTISATYFDYEVIKGFNLGLRFRIFNTRMLRCCYYWHPNYN